MGANQAAHPVAALCRALGVSESGYHAWRTRAPSPRARRDGELAVLTRARHAGSDATYGAPRVHEDPAEAGHRVGRKRVAGLMRADGLAGVGRRKGPPRATRTAPGAPQAPDLVRRDFTADAPDQRWAAGITHVPTYAGVLSLAVVLDAFSRRVVGWAMSTSLHAAVVRDALQTAAAQRRPAGVLHHSDQGSQYGALAFGRRCMALGVRPSMGPRGDAGGNAVAESLFATLDCELPARRRPATHAEARPDTFRYVEG